MRPTRAHIYNRQAENVVCCLPPPLTDSLVFTEAISQAPQPCCCVLRLARLRCVWEKPQFPQISNSFVRAQLPLLASPQLNHRPKPDLSSFHPLILLHYSHPQPYFLIINISRSACDSKPRFRFKITVRYNQHCHSRIFLNFIHSFFHHSTQHYNRHPLRHSLNIYIIITTCLSC